MHQETNNNYLFIKKASIPLQSHKIKEITKETSREKIKMSRSSRDYFCRQRKLKSLGALWSAILIFTIAALIALIFSLIQGKVNPFQREQWQNDDNSIGLSRGYLIAIWTVALSLITASYGFWRQCISDKFDDFFPVLLSANAISCFFSFILFFSFNVFFRGFRDGTGSMFFFALICLILSLLYLAVNIRTMGSSSRSLAESLLG